MRSVGRERLARRAIWGMAAACLLLVGGTACPSNCDRACGKLAFCGLLPDIDQDDCVERCEEREEPSGDNTRLCGDCAKENSCGTIANGSCSSVCDPVIGPDPDSGGEGGAGGAGGLEEGAGGVGGLAD